MQFNFDQSVDRRGTYSLKYDDRKYFWRLVPDLRLDEDSIRLLIADMDFQCAPAITRALHRVADFGTFGYTTDEASDEYREAIISWYQRRFGVELKREWIVHCSGALDGIGQSIRAFSSPGDGIILCRPVYSNFTSTIQRLGRRVVNCQMLQPSPGDYRMDWEKFERICADPENRVYVLCSPENPVGRVWTKEELARMTKICRENHVVLASDEIHSDLVRSWVKHIPVIDACADRSNLVMVSGVNKSFNLMGLQCAYTVIPDDELRARFCADYATEMPSPFSIAAMTAAYNESEDWLDALNVYLDESVRETVDYLKEKLPKASAYVPEGTYILWVDFSGYGYPADTLQYIVNHLANVAIQGGLSHDPEQGEHYLRLCLTSPKAVIREAIDRIAKAIEEYELTTR
ncbi:MAG: aminotransferase class I/II-fold pyridoxal phosphate-dependent enzyme [Lachnospiraceae bacterium]|nr:aminotransferase class I/II-fold pyridoxal phosphate-dependent enzyme [Lachnospiraceae bacterium]